VLPLLGFVETPNPLPNSISEAVLKGKGAAVAILAVALAGFLGMANPAAAAGDAPQPPRQKWSSAGPFGTYDRAQLQRGFKIYREVCQGCHGLALLSFRNLGETGGPEFSAAQVEAIAADHKIKDGPNDQGDMFERAGRAADRFPASFANDNAARAANGGALPPDFSVLAKARGYERGFPWFVIDMFTQYQEHGPDYIVALLSGYDKAPAGFTLAEGTSYNTYFPGHMIGMPSPLSDGQVDYTDGSPKTLDQYAKDVTAFLMWAAEPHLEARKRIGLQVMIFLIILAGLTYFTKKKVWSAVH
jgi:ubiquinol-cytochrome c reductase cytochrome b/c1 subunit